jgi:hypothetical protein
VLVPTANQLAVSSPSEDSDNVNPTGAPPNDASDKYGTGTALHGIFAVIASSQVNNLPLAYIVLSDDAVGHYEMDVNEALPDGTQPLTTHLTGIFGPPALTPTANAVAEPDVGQTTTLTLTLTLSQAAQQVGTVDVATADNGSAVAGVDYDPVSTTVTFNPGDTTKTVNVTVHGVAGTTANKTFVLNLSNPHKIGLNATQVVATIDAPPTVTPAGGQVNEPLAGQTGQAVFTLTLSQAPAVAATVDVSTVDGTATGGTDFDALTNSTVTFNPGETTQQVIVTVHGIIGTNTNKSFSLTLSNPHHLVLGNTTTVQMTIVSQIPIDFDARHPLTYTDSANHPVIIRLVGPGAGEALFSATATGDPQQIAVANTTAASSLIVRSLNGVTTLHDILVTGPLNFISGNANVVGDLSVSGTLRAAVLGDVSGQRTFTIGQAGINTVLRLGHVTDLSISTPGTIASLVALSWTDSNATADTITAAGLNAMSVIGAFGASLNLGAGGLGVARVGGAITGGTWSVGGSSRALVAKSIASTWAGTFAGDLGTVVVLGDASGSLTAQSARVVRVVGNLAGSLHMTGTPAALGTLPGLGVLFVGGTITGADVRSVSNINVVSAAAVANSRVFAGVADSTTVLPATAAEFTTLSTIGTFALRGGPAVATAFSNSYIAASSMKQVIVQKLTQPNGGQADGFATQSLTVFTDIEPGARPFRWNAKQDPALLTQQYQSDFKAELL